MDNFKHTKKLLGLEGRQLTRLERLVLRVLVILSWVILADLIYLVIWTLAGLL